MKERKYVKFRVDMLSDTKSKIIDTKPERDLIHYVWMALVLLAGKVNLEGDLYMTKNIPYTIETLAIEFNRGAYQVKLALDVLMELEMIELIGNNVYRVKNFAKHQNIKVKEKNNDKEGNVKNNEIELNENLINADVINLKKAPVNEEEVAKNKISKNKEENLKKSEVCSLEIIHKDINKIDDNNLSYYKLNNSQGNSPILLETKKNKKSNTRNKKESNIENIDEDIGDDMDECFHNGAQEVEDDICYFRDDGEGGSLGKDERLLDVWSF